MITVFFLSSCGEKSKNIELGILKEYFTSELSVTSKDGNVSFVFTNGEITFTKPEILRNATLTFKDGKGYTKLADYEIIFPESFLDSVLSLSDIYEKLQLNDFEIFKEENGKIFFEDCFLEINKDSLFFKTENNEYILTKRIDKTNEKDISNN